MALLRYILLAAFLGLCLTDKRRYDGYKVLRITPSDSSQLQSLVNLQDNLHGEVEFWTEPHHSGKPVDIMVGPAYIDSVRDILEDRGLVFSTMIEDVQQQADQVTIGQPGGISTLAGFRYDIYHTFDEIKQWVTDIAAEYSSFMTEDTLPQNSYKGNEIKFLKIGKPGINKPIFWWQSGTHSREWLASATTIKIVHLLATEYAAGKPEIVNLLDKVDFYIMPIFNPDGYIHTYTTDRLWRKTLAPTKQSWCTGTDPNRNFDDHWSESGSSVNPCSQTYHGDAPHSEIEVKTLTDYIPTLSNMKVFIDMHAYSQFWMFPYGYSKTSKPANYDDQLKLADKAMAALKAVHGKIFETGSIADVIYEASGSTVDWVYNNMGVPYCYAPELRDKGNYGFLAPSSEIYPSANEVYAAIKVIGNHIIN